MSQKAVRVLFELSPQPIKHNWEEYILSSNYSSDLRQYILGMVNDQRASAI
tara:strand:+ start:310 stop:462 length:153 start_codon:yes stop_codon:yes gene_type:complete